MARPPSITKEQVISAGIELESQDKPVNSTSLRAAIGGGNPARLFAIWSEYRGLNPVTTPAAQDQVDSGLPDSVVREIDRVTDRVKHLLMQTSESARGQVEAVAAAAIDEAKHKLTAAQSEQARWKQEAERLAKELQEMTVHARQAVEEKHELRFNLGAAEKLAADLDLKVSEAKTELEKLKKDNSALSERNAVLGQQIESVISESSLTENRLTAEVVQLRSDVKKLGTENSELAERNAGLIHKIELLQSLSISTENRLNADIAQLQAALEAARKENAELGAKNSRAEGELAGLKESLAASAKTITSLEAQLSDLKKPKAPASARKKPAARKPA